MDHNGPPASSPDGEQGAGAVAARPAAWLLWLAAAVGVAAFVIVALVVAGRSSQPPGVTPLPVPITLTGADIAFRVEGTQGNAPVGTLIVRYNGRWVIPKSAQGPITLAAR